MDTMNGPAEEAPVEEADWESFPTLRPLLEKAFPAQSDKRPMALRLFQELKHLSNFENEQELWTFLNSIPQSGPSDLGEQFRFMGYLIKLTASIKSYEGANLCSVLVMFYRSFPPVIEALTGTTELLSALYHHSSSTCAM
jgi:hypothetical protein